MRRVPAAGAAAAGDEAAGGTVRAGTHSLPMFQYVTIGPSSTPRSVDR